MIANRRGPKPYLPSQEEIRRECAKIRAGWSEEEHRMRATGLPMGAVRALRQWTPPVVSMADLEQSVDLEGEK